MPPAQTKPVRDPDADEPSADEALELADAAGIEDVVHHLEGCPAARRRLEQYSATRPARPDLGEPARPLVITRCITCGEQHVSSARPGGAP